MTRSPRSGAFELNYQPYRCTGTTQNGIWWVTYSYIQCGVRHVWCDYLFARDVPWHFNFTKLSLRHRQGNHISPWGTCTHPCRHPIDGLAKLHIKTYADKPGPCYSYGPTRHKRSITVNLTSASTIISHPSVLFRQTTYVNICEIIPPVVKHRNIAWIPPCSVHTMIDLICCPRVKYRY